MASSNNDEVISKASPHTIKKFELIEKYIGTWVQKLMNNQYCEGIIFIDCMCNSGVYYDEEGVEQFGTPLRVAKILRDASWQYPSKQVQLFFNDYSAEKTDLLKQILNEQLGGSRSNFTITVTTMDGNDLLKKIGPQLTANQKLHYFLFYDPFDASIDWEALAPFFKFWGEVMINHMLSDPIRAIGQVKKPEKKQKYQDTYLIDDFERLIPYGSDRSAYEKRLEDIIISLKGSRRRYYVGAFPFFNRNNALIYDLVHCTSNIEGFKLFKKTAWQTFGGKSSLKNTHGDENQLVFDENGNITTPTDESCFQIKDIAKYLQNHFQGQAAMPISQMWELLESHPIFPSDGYRKEIKKCLVEMYGARTEQVKDEMTGKKEYRITFLP